MAKRSRPEVLGMRATAQEADWVRYAARRANTTVSDLLRTRVICWAREVVRQDVAVDTKREAA